MKLLSQGTGHYLSEGERVEIIHDHSFETECDEPHPVRMRVDNLAGFSDWYRKSLMERGKVTTKLTKTGWVEYLSYQCHGDETHFYAMWTVRVDGDWTNEVYETFKHALGAAEEVVGEKLTLVRKPKEAKPTRVTVMDEAGRARWEACGHPAELDINEQCYVCHEDV